MGLSLISRDTVLPALASHLTDSKLAIGMIPAIYTMGFYLPQLFSANISERMVYKKPFVATVGFLGERLPYLLIGISLYLFATDAPLVALLLLFLFLGIASSSAGIATPAWYDMIAKVIPVHRRGIWSGLGHGLGAVLSVVVLFLVALPVMANVRLSDPISCILFLLAFVAAAVSWFGFALTREPPSEQVKETVPVRRILPADSRHSAQRRQLHALSSISRSVIQLATMASAFYIVYGADTFGVERRRRRRVHHRLSLQRGGHEHRVGSSSAIASGHKLVLTLAAFSLTLAAIIAITSPSKVVLAVTFALLGAYVAADGVSGLEHHTRVLRATGSPDLYRANEHATGACRDIGSAHRRVAGLAVRVSSDVCRGHVRVGDRRYAASGSG